MAIALIMAGGRSERMRRSAGPLHKALVPVLGVPLLERNLCALLSEGFDRIVVATSVSEPKVAEYIEQRGRALARARGAALEILWERQPLGTIGAAREAIGDADTLLVVNVDNLTSLRLKALVAYHHETRAALTIAAHEEPFQVPFGELDLRESRVLHYVEKPVRRTWISSGAYVLDREACLQLPAGRRTDVPQLVSALRARGRQVAAFRHDSPWIDVNESSSIQRAEELIGAHYRAFEWWRQPLDGQVAGLLLESPAGLLLERRSGSAADDPADRHVLSERVEPSDVQPEAAVLRMMAGRIEGLSLRFLTSFDDLGTSSGKLLRYHVYVADLGERWRDLVLEPNWEWHPLEAASPPLSRSRVLSRSMAALGRHLCQDALVFSR